jgi:hypothetical protein
MPQLHLPIEHDEADLAMAGEIAGRFDCAQLFVVWTPAHGQVVAEVIAELREPTRPRVGPLTRLWLGVRTWWTEGRMEASCEPHSPDVATARAKPAAGA